MDDFRESLDDLLQEATREANERMRRLFFDPATTDLVLGERILKNRKKGMQNLFILMGQWSPIMWLRSPEGFRFEIGEIDMRSMGQEALDPRIDDIVISSVRDKMIDGENEFLGALIRDAIHNPTPTFYEKETRG